MTIREGHHARRNSVDSNLRRGRPKVALAEQHGGPVIPLEEELGLNVL
ncbi:hypothetical protein [Lentzea sp.]|nr:hypothetical protein [Lentzea sp.]HUQ56316.1 hypothetical protein [Lentzea sp.]